MKFVFCIHHFSFGQFLFDIVGSDLKLAWRMVGCHIAMGVTFDLLSLQSTPIFEKDFMLQISADNLFLVLSSRA